MDNERTSNSPASERASRGKEVYFPHADIELRGILFGTPNPPSPAVVLIPDVHGVSPLYEELGAKLAASGVNTLVLDLYTREGTPTLGDMNAVFRWIDELPDARILGDIAAAAGHLKAIGASRVGVVGFCLGGQYAIMAACRIPQFAAAVSFYGMLAATNRSAHRPEAPLDMIGDLTCPLLGLYGCEDALIPGSDLDQLEQACGTANHSLELHRYPGAGHAFLNRFRPEAFREQAAEDAWARASNFLVKHLQ